MGSVFYLLETWELNVLAANCHSFKFPLQVAQKAAYCDPDVFGLFRVCMEEKLA